MSHSVLTLERVEKTYQTPGGGVPVLRDVSLDIAPGEFVMITGPSGSGKTTLLNLASLLDRPTGGRILFDGRDVTTVPEDGLCTLRKTGIGMVFQKFCLLLHRSVVENVMFRYRYTDVGEPECRERAAAALAEVGLSAISNREARLLSAGEMQRVAIARAVALRPSLLVADEPTGNLDKDSAAAVMESFQRLHGQGITILMVTHNDSLLRYGTRHLTCRDGGLS